MSAPAIVCSLTPKNMRPIEGFVRRHPGTTVIAHGRWSIAHADIPAAGGSLVVLETLIDCREQDILREVVARQEQLEGVLADPGWHRRWQESSIPSEVLRDCLCREAAARLPELIPLVAALQAALARYTIRLVIVIEDLTPARRIIVDWARYHGIPSIHLSHSLLLFEAYTVCGYVHADVLAVFGQRGVEGYSDIGLDPGRIRITGNPAWDDYPMLQRWRSQIRAAMATEYGLSTHKPIVVFGTTWAGNLTALDDEALYGDTLRAFLAACKKLFDAGSSMQAVVKDRPRPATSETGAQSLRRLMAELGLAPESVCYAEGDAVSWLLTADVLVSVDSNLSIEAMLAGVPAINLLNEPGLFLGPCFAVDSGILEVEASVLAPAIEELLMNADLRARQLDAMRHAAVYHNIGVDGRATERVVSLMNEMALPKKHESESVSPEDLPGRHNRETDSSHTDAVLRDFLRSFVRGETSGLRFAKRCCAIVGSPYLAAAHKVKEVLK